MYPPGPALKMMVSVDGWIGGSTPHTIGIHAGLLSVI